MRFQEMNADNSGALKARDFFGLFALLVFWMTVGKILFEMFANFIIIEIDYFGGISQEARKNMVTIGSAILTTLSAGAVQIFLISRLMVEKNIISTLRYIGFVRSPAIHVQRAILIGVGIVLLHGPILNMLFPPAESFEPSEYLKIRRESGIASKILLFPLAVVVGPVVEESLFRGAYFNALKTSFGPAIAAVICSGLFVLLHADTWSSGYWVTISALIWLSIGLMFIRIRSGSVIPAIVCHAAFNLILVLAG
jgi:membrane protease YdiL (CAAX protease family)